ncbi:MAG: Gx transporter family protein [Clostridiaceae bacterium]
MNIKKMVYLSLMASQALLLFIIEAYIPVPLPAIGVKLGLSNIIILLVLYTYSYKEALIVLLLKLILSMFFSGSPSMLLYSLAGGLLSLYFMNLFKIIFKDSISIIGVSLIGAAFHNIGQIAAAIAIHQNLSILFYLPIVLLSSIFTGLLIGAAAKFTLENFIKTSESGVNH